MPPSKEIISKWLMNEIKIFLDRFPYNLSEKEIVHLYKSVRSNPKFRTKRFFSKNQNASEAQKRYLKRLIDENLNRIQIAKEQDGIGKLVKGIKSFEGIKDKEVVIDSSMRHYKELKLIVPAGYNHLLRHINSPNIDIIVIETQAKLTPTFLSSSIVPYIKAIAALQRVFNSIKDNVEKDEIVISYISQNSPIETGIKGVTDALVSLKEDIIPWRKQYAKARAAIELKNSEAELKRKVAETLELRSKSAKDEAEAEKLRAEAAKTMAEAEKIRLENEKLQFELNSSRLTLAIDLIMKINPDLPEPARIVRALELLPALNALTNNDLEITQISNPSQTESASDQE